jgi:predicted RNase H-like nuclease
MKFIGVDLGWRTGASGLSCLEWQNGQLALRETTCRQSLVEILAWIDEVLPPGEGGLVAVDAPTLIPNATGTRLPDRLTHRYFGKYHAGCYPANLGRPFAERTVQMGLELEQRGFVHAPTIQPQSLERYQIEVFPHPAMVHLFGLGQILKYKKGKLKDRKQELQRLQAYLQTVLPSLTPAVRFTEASAYLWESPLPLTGPQLKTLEDQLDSLVCAYVGAHWWYWGQEKNWVLGDYDHGYIIVPAPHAQGGQG